MSGVAAVTGATGVLGTELAERLNAAGWTVRGLSRSDSDRDRPPEIEWTFGDVRDEEAVEQLLSGADVAFHLAGLGLWQASPETVRSVNVDGTRTLLDVASEQDVNRVIFSSTAGTRRASGTTAATEADVATPIGAYQASKAAAELLVDRYARSHDAVTVHPTAVVAPEDEGITARLVALARDPTVPVYPPGGISIVSVADVVDGLVAAIDQGTSGRHYILGGENLTYRAAIDRLEEETDGRPARFRIPAWAIHAAGPVASAIGTTTGRQLFPFSPAMARLATRCHFYSSQRASDELDYTYRPLEATMRPVLDGRDSARR